MLAMVGVADRGFVGTVFGARDEHCGGEELEKLEVIELGGIKKMKSAVVMDGELLEDRTV
jgi:hypothetical protein